MSDRDITAAVETVREALQAGIDAARPEAVVDEAVSVADGTLVVAGERIPLADYDEVLVLGGGNAAGRVARAVSERLGEELDGGVVVTDDPVPAGPVDVVAGSHPLPEAANRDGADTVLERARDAGERTLVLGVVTGGASALLPAPAGECSLADLRALTDDLLRAGVPIDRINAVRKHVSASKGGRLARAAAPARVVGIALSDVASDDPAVIGSGPFSPDATTYDDALATLAEYDINPPDSVAAHLRAGAAGDWAETPGPGDEAFDRVAVHVVADNRTAIDGARAVCEAAGYDTLVLSSSVRGEAREAAKTHVAIAEEMRRSGDPIAPPAAVLSGGEVTVTVTGDGTGGPNQAFALSAALELPEGTVLGCVDTDGIDGATDAAGAVVTSETVDDERAATAALADDDTDPYLAERDARVVTGQTGTNVNDLRVLLVE